MGGVSHSGGADGVSFDAASVLDGLKPFQRDTVEYVFGRLFHPSDPVDHFLVADEVGLGKTMVARGVIAKLIELHLQEPGRRIDVIYVCSNHAIARQNFAKLALVGAQRGTVTDRITTLPLHVHGLDEAPEGFDRGINFVPITPTTSLDLSSGVGRSDERALLLRLLGHERLLGAATRRKGAVRLFTPPVQIAKNFKDTLKQVRAQQLDPSLAGAFVDRLRSHPGSDDEPDILGELGELIDAFRSERRLWLEPWRTRRTRLIARLRRILAASCVKALEPDLVILDEFQRFPKLMDPSSPTGELASHLIGFEGCKTLLLSATPYKPYSRAQEIDEDHHKDFQATTAFLLNDPHRVPQLNATLVDYRQALRRLGRTGSAPVLQARDAVVGELRRVMCRTERLGAGGDRDGMLLATPPAPITPRLLAGDLRAYAELDGVARELGARDVVEYWKSTPYALQMMDGYQLSGHFEARQRSSAPLDIRHSLDAGAVRRYERIDPGNARMRGLIDALDGESPWRCLWLPPSLEYVTPGTPFDTTRLRTKRLVFSRWAVVPKAIAAVVSYHADRAVYADHDGVANSADSRSQLGQPLQIRPDQALTEALLMLPLRALGRLTDPLEISGLLGGTAAPVRRDRVEQAARRNVRQAVTELNLPDRDGREDYAWYTIAALRLEDPHEIRRWLRSDALAGPSDSGWRREVERILRALDDDEGLGAVPKNLVEILAHAGLAAPGICAVRALDRLALAPDATQAHALAVGNAMRLLFNLPEAVAIIRTLQAGQSRRSYDERSYWRAVLDYCLAGNLQAVLDEYVHALRDWVGGEGPQQRSQAIADAMTVAIGLTATSLTARDIGDGGHIQQPPIAFHTRFAARLGQKGKAADADAVQRVEHVRAAFNSPFWPFVLASTSIGQEGLDFHLYSHAIVHWNLPSNPVDMEQREGRIHRFKNHAVRRNLAKAHRAAAFSDAYADPWAGMFADVGDSDRGLRPYWVLSGEASIERHVPAEPLSIDRHHLDELVTLMGIYRLAFGQPRQEELLAAVRATKDLNASDADQLAIDLSPPPFAAS